MGQQTTLPMFISRAANIMMAVQIKKEQARFRVANLNNWCCLLSIIFSYYRTIRNYVDDNL